MDYLNLINKKFSGDISTEQMERLQQWLKQKKENQNVYDEIAELWEFSTPPKIKNQTPALQNWEKIDQNLNTENLVQKSLFDKIEELIQNFFDRLIPRSRFGIVTAACSLFLLFGFGTWKLYQHKNLFKNISTSNAQISKIELSDASEITLNCNSSVEYLKSFSDSIRQVKLTGEAFFNVTKNKRPFVVITENTKTTVLGTMFNVWARNNETRVIVKQGAVLLNSKDTNTSGVELKANQMSTACGNKVIPPAINVDANYLLGWLNSKLVFQKTPLHEIIDELHRRFNVEIQLDSSIKPDNTLTADFDTASVDDILTFICTTLDVKYLYQNGVYLITKE